MFQLESGCLPELFLRFLNLGDIRIDGHFGNGTSDIFYESDQVLCWSIHQNPGYPDTGLSINIGAGKGVGYNINVELPPGSADDIYMDAISTFLPVAKQFNPDYVGVSAGFDAHKTDMMLDLKLSVDSFYKTGRILRDNFKNIFAVLEGGYNPEILYMGVQNFMAGINGEEIKYSETLSETDIKIMDVYEHKLTSQIVNLRKYWKF